MQRETGPAGERWQQLIEAFDPERNLQAINGLWQQAASGSEQVLGSMTQRGTNGEAGDPTGETTDAFPGASLLRDAFVEMERSFGRMYNAMGSMMVEGPLRSAATAHSIASTEIVVIDGVGTTSITVADAASTPSWGGLRRHDGQTIAPDAVRVLASSSFDTAEPVFVVRVDVDPQTEPGVYHGQLLVSGLPDFTLPLVVRVIDASCDE